MHHTRSDHTKVISTKKRPPGRPQMRWTDQIRKDTDLPLQTAERRTMNRDAWRARNSGRARGINA